MLRRRTSSTQSPDLNPIEIVWGEMDRRVKVNGPTSAPHPSECLQDCWKNISGDYLMKFIVRMPRLWEVVFKAKGGYFENLKYNFLMTLFDN